MMEADTDRDGKISFEEFTKMVENTDVSMSMTLGTSIFRERSSAFMFFDCLTLDRAVARLQPHSNN